MRDLRTQALRARRTSETISALYVSPKPKNGPRTAQTIVDRIFQPFEHKPDLEGSVWPYADHTMPHVQATDQIRGVYAEFLYYFFSRALNYKTPIAYQTPMFEAKYLPPNHLVALGRKSRPALVSMFGKGEDYNGGMPSPRPTVQSRSRNPMHYAYWRNQISKRMRRALYNSLERLGPLDGVFLVRSNGVPIDLGALQKHMDMVVMKARRMNQTDQWVTDSMHKKHLDALNGRLAYKRMAQIKMEPSK